MGKVAVDVRDLKVYQASIKGAMDIFQITKRFPTEEQYSLSSQIRKSSRSVCANLSEAWRKRSYKGAFLSTMTIALGEASETRVWLEISFQCGYLGQEEFHELDRDYDNICRMLSSMTLSPEKWLWSNNRV